MESAFLMKEFQMRQWYFPLSHLSRSIMVDWPSTFVSMHYGSEGFIFLTFWDNLSVSSSTSTTRGEDEGGGCTLKGKTDDSEEVGGLGELAIVMKVGSSSGNAGGGVYGFHAFGGGGGTDSPIGRCGGPRLMLTSLSLSDDIHGE
jgi:hypothetical protein